MNKHLLELIHRTLLSRSIKYKYYDFPKTLTSITTDEPSTKQISKDYGLMSSHFRHPVFSSFIPTYDEIRLNKNKAWLERYFKNMAEN